MHLNSLLLFRKFAQPFFKDGMQVLEIGAYPVECSEYKKEINSSAITWHSLDMRPHPALTYLSTSEYEFPVESGLYDIVLSGQVIEHVRKPWIWMKEVARVCKPGGLVITLNPTSWPYHEAPVDCWRIYPEGMRALSEECGLEVVVCEFECLEIEPSAVRLPGRSATRRASRIAKLLRQPVECAFDTVTVARKSSV